MTVFSLFFVELMAMRYATFATGDDHTHGHEHSKARRPSHHTPGENHLSHAKDHIEPEEAGEGKSEAVAADPKWYSTTLSAETGGDTTIHDVEDYAAQLTAITILEFGVIFHSIFIGLTLAVAGEEFNTLYVVLVFHQTFEGLGLGSRLAATPWPKSRRWTAYLFALAYGLTTPIAIAVGLGVRETYAPGSRTALLVNGVFDSISAGILLYTGLVELMAHEFMFSAVMRRAPKKVVLTAFGVMCLGAGKSIICYPKDASLTVRVGLMALLGKWA